MPLAIFFSFFYLEIWSKALFFLKRKVRNLVYFSLSLAFCFLILEVVALVSGISQKIMRNQGRDTNIELMEVMQMLD